MFCIFELMRDAYYLGRRIEGGGMAVTHHVRCNEDKYHLLAHNELDYDVLPSNLRIRVGDLINYRLYDRRTHSYPGYAQQCKVIRVDKHSSLENSKLVYVRLVSQKAM